MHKNKKILIIGAFERDNFGDILFGKIFEKLLSNYNLTFASLISNDLTNIGGFKVLSINTTKNLNIDFDAVIYCGGEILTSKKIDAISMDLGNNALSNIYGEHNNDLAYVYSNSFIQTNIKAKTGFISVGGFDQNKCSPNLNKILSSANTITVRDHTTKANLSKSKIKVYPDLVHTISKLFSTEINQESIKISNKNYLIFQANDQYITKTGIQSIGEKLIKLASQNNLSIIFQPAGLAYGHDSLSKLSELNKFIKQNSNIKSTIQNNRNIWTQVAYLKNSKLNIGTSLHLAIVSMSFNVPFTSLQNDKVTNYLSCWHIDNTNYDTTITLTNKQKNKYKLLSAQAQKSIKLLFDDLKLTPNIQTIKEQDNNKIIKSLYTEIQLLRYNSQDKIYKLKQENKIIKDSKLFKLWPLYTKIKNIFTK